MKKVKTGFEYWPQVILLILAISTVGIASYFLLKPTETERQLPAEKKIAIRTLINHNDKDISLASLLTSDKNLVIFWATWCGPCVEEMKRMPKLLPKIKEKGYEPVFVNYDSPENKIVAEKFAKGYGVNSSFDLKGEILYDLGISSLPVSLVVDKSGKILRTLWGEIQESQL